MWPEVVPLLCSSFISQQNVCVLHVQSFHYFYISIINKSVDLLAHHQLVYKHSAFGTISRKSSGGLEPVLLFSKTHFGVLKVSRHWSFVFASPILEHWHCCILAEYVAQQGRCLRSEGPSCRCHLWTYSDSMYVNDLHGNCYCKVERDGAPRVPCHP